MPVGEAGSASARSVLATSGNPGRHTRFHGRVEVMKWLLKARASIDAADAKGGTALMFAAAAGNARLVRLLIEHGAKVDTVDTTGLSAMELALRGDHEDAAERPAEEGEDVHVARSDLFRGGQRHQRRLIQDPRVREFPGQRREEARDRGDRGKKEEPHKEQACVTKAVIHSKMMCTSVTAST